MVSVRTKKECRPLLFAAVLAAAIGVSGCGQHGSVQTYLENAKAFQKKGDNKAAIIELKNALQVNPDNGEARYMLGMVYSEAGDFESAETELRRALQFGVERNRVLLALGRVLLDQGLFQKVLGEIKAEPGLKGDMLASVLTLRADAYLSLKKTKEAQAALDEALRVHPGFSDAYVGKAQLALLGQDLKEALRQTDVALDKAPGNVRAWLMKGDILRLQDKTDDALSAYQQAVKNGARNVSAHLALASLYVANKKLDLARKETATAREISPNNLMARYLTALLDYREAKYPEARDELQLVLRNRPNHMPSVLLSGAVEFALKNYAQAETHFNKFLSQYPGDISARKLLTATLLKTGQAERALKAIEPALSEKTQDLQSLVLAGEVYRNLKQYDKASFYLKKAATIDPSNATLRTELAVSQMGRGESDLAVAELESASALDASHYQADTLLILTYFAKKEFDNALQATFVLEKKQPKNPATFNFRGGAYLGKGDTANARKSFEQALALQPTYVEAAVNLAQMDVKDNKPDAARKRFENILAKDKDNLEAMLALANLALKSGKMEDYAGWLDKAIKARPEALAPRRLLASYYMQKRESDKALRLARDALALSQDNPGALDLLGSIQNAAGEKDNALATYTKLVTTTPDSPAAFYKLALLQVSMKNTRAAKVSLKKVLELSPNYADAQVTLISIEVQDGNTEEALRIARQLQKQAANAALGFVLEGDVLSSQKRYADAADVYGKAFAAEKSGMTAVKRHEAKALAGRVKEADAELLQWLKAQPKDFAARGYLAQAYMTRGDNKLAIEQYQEILKNQPGNPSGLNNLAWLYYREKDPRALEVAEQVYKLQPNAAPIADTFGWILLEQGRTARGVEILQKAASLAPNNSEIGYHYAVALYKSGEKQKARRQLEQVLASGKSFPQQDEARALLKQL